MAQAREYILVPKSEQQSVGKDDIVSKTGEKKDNLNKKLDSKTSLQSEKVKPVTKTETKAKEKQRKVDYSQWIPY